MASWIAARSDAGLRLIGVRSGGERDASRSLAAASLMVQRMTGVVAEPVLVEPGVGAVLAGAGEAALLVVGLADDWRSAGIGAVRSHIARHAEVPLLFVRRGAAPGRPRQPQRPDALPLEHDRHDAARMSDLTGRAESVADAGSIVGSGHA